MHQLAQAVRHCSPAVVRSEAESLLFSAAACGIYGFACHPDWGNICCMQSLVELLSCTYSLSVGDPEHLSLERSQLLL